MEKIPTKMNLQGLHVNSGLMSEVLDRCLLLRKIAVSVGVRGPVTISIAKSVSPVDIISMQIVKSVNSEDTAERASDTMGMKHRVAFGLYLAKGSINCQLAEKTGFSDEDAEKIKEAMRTLLENDASSARPEGSMEVCALYWWEQEGKTPKYSSAKVQRSLQVTLKKVLQSQSGLKITMYRLHH